MNTVYINALIYDGGKESSANAVLVKDGVINKIASLEEIKTLLKPTDKIVDLKGARMMPGFIESHAHLLMLGQSRVNLDFRDKNLKEIIIMLKKQSDIQPPGTWIKGRSWDQNLWSNKTLPTKFLLEDVSKTHPIYLRRIDGHAAWVNTIALKKAGLTSFTKDIAGGEIIRDKDGEPTGVLIDNAMALVEKIIDQPTKDELAHFLEIGQNEALSVGITSLQDAGSNNATLELFREYAKKDKLKVRIYAMIEGSDDKLVNKYLKEGPISINNYLNIRCIKYFADGALGSHGALMLDDYSDKPGNKGLALIDQEQLTKKTIDALENGFQVATHAIGDRANRVVLNAYEEALKKVPNKEARLRIEHAQLIHPDDHNRFRDLNIIASMQPIHCTSDMAWIEERLGKERLQNRAYIWRTLLSKNIRLAFGSDSPVEPINPIFGLYAATTRQNTEGLPKDGFMPEEKLMLKEALNAFFTGAAYAEFAEAKKGRIAEGYLADFVVFDDDIIKMAPKDFLKAKPLMTIVGGRIVYKR